MPYFFYKACSVFFYKACSVDELPEGSKKRVVVEDYSLCLYNVDGTLFASGDPCPHERVSLGDGGTMCGEVVTCGAHRWSFNVRTGDCLDDAGFPLKTFPVGRKEGFVYVGFWTDDGETPGDERS